MYLWPLSYEKPLTVKHLRGRKTKTVPYDPANGLWVLTIVGTLYKLQQPVK